MCSQSHTKYLPSFQPPPILVPAQVNIVAWRCHLPTCSLWLLMWTSIHRNWGEKEKRGKKAERFSTDRKVELLIQSSFFSSFSTAQIFTCKLSTYMLFLTPPPQKIGKELIFWRSSSSPRVIPSFKTCVCHSERGDISRETEKGRDADAEILLLSDPFAGMWCLIPQDNHHNLGMPVRNTCRANQNTGNSPCCLVSRNTFRHLVSLHPLTRLTWKYRP